MTRLSIEIEEGKELAEKLQKSSTVEKPLADRLRKLVLTLEGIAKKATVVDTGRLRASITHTYEEKSGFIGTNVQYAPFVEYGTKRMAARHMDGATKVLGQGMFDYTIQSSKDEIGDFEANLSTDYERGLSD